MRRVYQIPSSSFGRMLSESLIIFHYCKSKNRKLFLFTQKSISNFFVLEILGADSKIMKSLFSEKIYSLLLKLKRHALFLNQDRVFEGSNFFLHLLHAQRYYRIQFLSKTSAAPLSELVHLKNRPIVVFAARTDHYWRSNHSNTEDEIAIRNSRIEWIEQLIRMLLDNEFSVIRIGTQANAPLSIKNRFYFDYSLSKIRNDKGDFEICRQADFAVTTGGGVSLLPSLMGIPGLMVNTGLFSDLQPQEFLHHYLPKSVHWQDSGLPLNLEELNKIELLSMQRGSDYSSKGLELHEVSPEDSLATIQDFFHKTIPGIKQVSPSKDNFNSVPLVLLSQFPAEVPVSGETQAVGVRVHGLWKNF